jgi:hypothetical protein
MQRQAISSFKDGLIQLQRITSFEGLREAIKDIIDICPPTEAHLCKPRIAALMRKKHFAEIRKVKGHPTALKDIDAKYRNLAIVLHKLPIGGMRRPRPRSAPAHALPQEPRLPSSNRRLPAKPGGFGAFGLATSLAKNWLVSRKKQIAGLGVAAAGLGGLAWVYNKVYGSNNKEVPRKNPDDGSKGRQKQLESFEKAMMSMQRFKAMTQMSKDPDASIGDYKDLFTLGPAKKKRNSKKNKKKERGVNWQREGDSSQKDLERAYKAIGKKSSNPVEIPLLTTKDFSANTKTASKSKTRKRRKKSPPAEAPPYIEPEPKEPRIVKARKPRSSKPRAKAKADLGGVAAPSKLVPVVKRTKRVRKVR